VCCLKSITLQGLVITIKTTKNFWQAIALIRSKQKKKIVFRNGLTLRLSNLEYFPLRYLIASGCKVEKVDDNLLSFKGNKFEIRCSSELWDILANIQKNTKIKRLELIDKDTFKVESEKYKLIGNYEMLGALCEIESGLYDCECSGKSVLDVGGFQGESAVLFSKMGARRLIVYEPVVPHHKFIKINMALNNVNAELHEEGVGCAEGIHTIHYDNFGLGFGLDVGSKIAEIRIRNITDVIEESKADIAKFDCEGAEKTLAQVPIQTLRKISYYIVEVHDSKILEDLIQKFKTSGFVLKRNINVSVHNKYLRIVHFARTADLKVA
jgi:FkbM family methyltransferase